jgi:hypothetical protein
MSSRLSRQFGLVGVSATAVLLGVAGLTFAGAVTNWIPTLVTGSKGEGAARAAVTSVTSNPTTFSAACTSSSSESAVLTWSSAGSAVTGYEVLVSSTSSGSYALDATQPTGTALTVTETYSSSTTGKKYYRLEAKTLNWPFPGTTITNAREASVSGTNGGYLTMASTGTECAATA